MGGWRRSSQRVGATHHESKPPRTRSPAVATRRAATDMGMQNNVRTETCHHTVVRMLAWRSRTQRLTLLQLCTAVCSCRYLRGDAAVHQVLQQFLVVMSQDVFDHA